MNYDFAEAADFLDSCVNRDEMYDDVMEAMSAVATIRNRRNGKAADFVWHTLLTCADFLDTITTHERKEVTP